MNFLWVRLKSKSLTIRMRLKSRFSKKKTDWKWTIIVSVKPLILLIARGPMFTVRPGRRRNGSIVSTSWTKIESSWPDNFQTSFMQTTTRCKRSNTANKSFRRAKCLTWCFFSHTFSLSPASRVSLYTKNCPEMFLKRIRSLVLMSTRRR